MESSHYLGIYRLDFSRFEQMKEKIEQHQGDLKPRLQETFNTCSLTQRLSEIISQMEFFSSVSPSPNFQPILEKYQKCRGFLSSLSQTYQGTNPYEIQELVNQIMGISEIPLQASQQSRLECFSLMKESGFLITDYTSVNTENDRSIIYNPGQLAAQYLEKHPEVVTLAFGCGEMSKSSFSSCYNRRSTDHLRPLITLDLHASTGPDFPVNMHNANFWKEIPNERFERIVDHTYGCFIFEDSRSLTTIQHIYRTLSPGGYFELDHAFSEPQIDLLRQAGFEIEGTDSKIAKKHF